MYCSSTVMRTSNDLKGASPRQRPSAVVSLPVTAPCPDGANTDISRISFEVVPDGVLPISSYSTERNQKGPKGHMLIPNGTYSSSASVEQTR